MKKNEISPAKMPTIKKAVKKPVKDPVKKNTKSIKSVKNTPPKKRGRPPKKPPLPKKLSLKERLSKKIPSIHTLVILFFGAIFLGAGLFFITHPLSRYHFKNPFARIEKVFTNTFLHSTSKPQSNTIDYASYTELSKNISMDNKEAIRNFLGQQPNSPLSKSLRNKWLLLLVKENKWEDFLNDYRPTNNQEVECYYLQALIHSGQKNLALTGVKRLWKAGYKPTMTCKNIFLEWQKSGDFKEKYIWPRLQLAIDQKDEASIQQLKSMLPANQQIWVTQWIAIRKNPTLLLKTSLPDNAQGQRIIIDGLKKWVDIDVKKIMAEWPLLQKKYHFSTARTQDFYRAVSLQLVLSGNPEAETWFAKILPTYGTTQSRAWQVRFALTHRRWKNVLSLIQSMPAAEQNTNIWQYWKARALQSLGETSQANPIYEKLSTQRQYYGFLASYRLHKPLSIQQENYINNTALLSSYSEQIDQIKQLYETNQETHALQLTQDLLNRLDNPGQYALANRFAEWGWYSESMNIINRSPYQNDLKLRFPFPHQALILKFSAQAGISPALVYSIARQESNFHEDVFSSAGGLGILQITLVTARQFSPHITQQDLYHPETNISLGITYLKRLTRQFNGHPLLIASAYNAGPQKTRSWQPKNGPMSADIWIEIRPWEETRNYLKNILAYDAVYQYLLGQTPNIDAFMENIP